MNVRTDYTTVAMCPIVRIPMDLLTAFAKLVQNTKVSDTDMNCSRDLILFYQWSNNAERGVKNYADRSGGYYPPTEAEAQFFAIRKQNSVIAFLFIQNMFMS